MASLVRRLEAEAARLKLATRRMEEVAGERPGTCRSVLVEIRGAGADRFAGGWTGTLCWQAPSPYRSSTGRKNWYVIAERCDRQTPRTVFDESDVDMVPIRTGGPGGQHRNEASTAVRATHRPTRTVVVVDTERRLSLNRRIALDLLRERIEQGDVAAERAAVTARWRVHDDLVRGNPFEPSDPN